MGGRVGGWMDGVMDRVMECTGWWGKARGDQIGRHPNSDPKERSCQKEGEPPAPVNKPLLLVPIHSYKLLMGACRLSILVPPDPHLLPARYLPGPSVLAVYHSYQGQLLRMSPWSRRDPFPLPFY